MKNKNRFDTSYCNKACYDKSVLWVTLEREKVRLISNFFFVV